MRNSKSDKGIQKIARVRTLTVLSLLDNERKKTLLQFLHEAELINKGKPVIRLEGANLSKAILNGAKLRSVFMSDADLSIADLSRASFLIANLKGEE